MNTFSSRIAKYCVLLSVMISLPAAQISAGKSSQQEIATVVMPFTAFGCSSDYAVSLVDALIVRLSYTTTIAAAGDVAIVMDDEDECEESEKKNAPQCIESIGRFFKATNVIYGHCIKTEHLTIIQCYVYSSTETKTVWQKEYHYHDSLTKTVESISTDITQDLNGVFEKKIIREGEDSASQMVANNAGVVEILDNGVVPALSFGLSGFRALQKTIGDQSPYGFMGFCIVPLSSQRQLRIRAGVPLFPSKNALNKNQDDPDPLLSAEHEWSSKRFAISAGLASIYYSNGQGTLAPGIIFAIRGGLTTKGFFGRVIFPPAFLLFDDGDNNYFGSFSTYWSFSVGNEKRNKLGFGTTGFFKTNACRVTSDNGIGYNSQTDFYAMFPAFRTAHCLGDHIVASINLELGNLLFGRFLFFEPDNEGWRPSIAFDFVYSFGKIRSPTLFNGEF